MTVRQHKRLIVTASALLLVGAAAVVAVGWNSPIKVVLPEPASIVQSSNGPAAGNTAQNTPAFAPTLADLRGVTAIDLRRPLFDVAAANTTAQTTVVAGSSLPIRLLAIANESATGQPIATFVLSDGKSKPFAVGELIEDAGRSYTVQAIERDHVTVKFGDVWHELHLPETP
jgi:hypothetical protein